MNGDPTGAVKLANKRGAARLAAVQALYQMDLTSQKLMEVIAEFENFRLGKEVDSDVGPETYREADPQWFRSICAGVVAEQKRIDPVIAKVLPDGWPLSRIETLLRAILRAGVWELLAKKDVPAKVIISEYLDVTKAFFEDDEHRLVNGALDRVARKHRDELTLADAPVSAEEIEAADNGQKAEQG